MDFKVSNKYFEKNGYIILEIKGKHEGHLFISKRYSIRLKQHNWYITKNAKEKSPNLRTSVDQNLKYCINEILIQLPKVYENEEGKYIFDYTNQKIGMDFSGYTLIKDVNENHLMKKLEAIF